LLLALATGACGHGEAPGAAELAEPSASPPSAPDERADIVLVVIDTLRPDFTEVGGETRPTTPFLKEIARSGVVFTQAFSTSSWTAPSTASVFTGLYPPSHGVVHGFFVPARREQLGKHVPLASTESLELRPLPSGWPTLPERMRAAGYQTFGVASNVNVGRELGFDRGFDHFQSERLASIEQLGSILESWKETIDPSRPCFFYLHANDVHDPYEGREPWYQAGLVGVPDWIARYRSEIRYVDETLRALSERMGWGTETARLIVSDHGEEFMDHGEVGHGYSLHGEVNRVLMILSPPRWAGGPRLVPCNVSLIDVLPTLLDLAGVAPDLELAGRSLLPLARGEAAAFEACAGRTLFAHRKGAGDLWAAMRGDWKLIDDTASRRRSLFDLRADPGEREDRIARQHKVAAELFAELERFEGTKPIEDVRVEVGLDAELLQHLKDLGYAAEGD